MTLEEIKKARAAITPGPWKSYQDGKCHGNEICESGLFSIQTFLTYNKYRSPNEVNMGFIAKYPEYVDFLLIALNGALARISCACAKGNDDPYVIIMCSNCKWRESLTPKLKDE